MDGPGQHGLSGVKPAGPTWDHWTPKHPITITSRHDYLNNGDFNNQPDRGRIGAHYRHVVRPVITLGFFFVMLIGQTQVAMGPYADWVSCQTQAMMMEGEGATTSVCYETMLPSPDSTVELERDSSS